MANNYPKRQETILPDLKKCRFLHVGFLLYHHYTSVITRAKNWKKYTSHDIVSNFSHHMFRLRCNRVYFLRLFVTIRYSRLFAIRVFQTPYILCVETWFFLLVNSNGNRTEWSTIQWVISNRPSARLIWNYEHEYPWIVRHKVLLPVNRNKIAVKKSLKTSFVWKS